MRNLVDRGVWRAAVPGVSRAGNDLVTKPSILYSSLFSFYSFNIYCMNISHYIFLIHSFYYCFGDIIALQCCVSFCCVTAWIYCMYTCIPSLLSLNPIPHPAPLGHHRAWAELPVLYSSFLLASYYTHGSGYMSVLLSQSAAPSPSPVVSTVHCSLCLHLYLCPVNRFICNIFLDSTYMNWHIVFIFIFLIYLTLYDLWSDQYTQVLSQS